MRVVLPTSIASAAIFFFQNHLNFLMLTSTPPTLCNQCLSNDVSCMQGRRLCSRLYWLGMRKYVPRLCVQCVRVVLPTSVAAAAMFFFQNHLNFLILTSTPPTLCNAYLMTSGFCGGEGCAAGCSGEECGRTYQDCVCNACVLCYRPVLPLPQSFSSRIILIF